jgi:long-chain acyl-CoA synthetase
MLIKDLLNQQSARTPDATALIFKENETTWREIDSLSNRFAQGLMELGLRKGDRVAAVLNNCLEFVVTYLALLKNGGIFVPLNFQLTAPHIKYIVHHSESKFLICNDEFYPTVKEILPRLPDLNHVITVGKKTLRKGEPDFQDVLSMGKDLEPSISLNEDDIAVFLYTAGTTGDPKGVVHSHFNCSFVARHWAQVFRMEPGKTVLMVLPLFHAFGIHCILLPALISGGCIIMADKYSTEWALEALQKYGINALPLVPAMGNLIINHENFSKYDLSHLETLLMGGAIVPFELLKRWRETFPALEIINGFGQTESCPCSTGLWDVDILEKPRSVGKPWSFVELKILDESGNELKTFQSGEIVYKVPSIMEEYYKEPELTAETIRDGWLYSGDIGYLDEDGYVYIVDRKKDIIIRGGENISSMEVEEVLHQHPAILEASAIGAPHTVLGETVMAVVVKKPDFELSEKDVIQFCEGNLEPFKVPTQVQFTDELPRNPAGKVLKRELKRRML